MNAAARFWSAAAQATIAELAWHLLGPSWAFGLAVLLIARHLPAMATGAEKAAAVEKRVNNLVPAVAGAQTDANTANTRVGNLSGGTTSTNGLPDGTLNGSSGTAGLPDGTLNGISGDADNNGVTSGQIGGASAHYHDMSHHHYPGNYAVTNGQHSHGAGNYAVTQGQHSHSLPNV